MLVLEGGSRKYMTLEEILRRSPKELASSL
jgi:hypothetical protein